MKKKLLVIQVAALSYDLLERNKLSRWSGFEFQPAQSVFPALTCPVQATFRTAAHASEHGMVANGRFFRDLARPMFWEQSAQLVDSSRIWSDFRKRGGRVGMFFWQQSLGEDVDLVLSPAPIHKHHGGMIQDCYSQPPDLYAKLCTSIGRTFQLQHYWGPRATAKVGDWIASATAAVLERTDVAPDLLFTYLPSLDYDLQRWGPLHQCAEKALRVTLSQLKLLTEVASRHGYEVLLFGDYAIAEVDSAIFPNRILCDAGLMSTRDVNGMHYTDFHASRAFAMVDHEIAHIYIKDPDDLSLVRKILATQSGVADILDQKAQASINLDNSNCGELIVIADEGKWFAYPWWTHRRQAPDYASHIDIHNKPGYDPCELFWGWPPLSVSQDTSRIRGSHGRVGAGREIVWTSTIDFTPLPDSLYELAALTHHWLDDAS